MAKNDIQVYAAHLKTCDFDPMRVCRWFNPDVFHVSFICGGRESVRLTFVPGVRGF